ncbi:MAG: hypothetical protein ACJAYN_001725 [Bermanella sp.]|jgi:hypothetical protein
MRRSNMGKNTHNYHEIVTGPLDNEDVALMLEYLTNIGASYHRQQWQMLAPLAN